MESNILDSQVTQPQLDDACPMYISLMSCDNHSMWLKHSKGFRRKFVDETSNNQPTVLALDGLHFNDKPANGSHLCYHVHASEEPHYPGETCKWREQHIIQPPASGAANLFNTIYWRRCDGTFQNALSEKLKNADGSDRTHSFLQVRLRDVLVPRTDWRCPENSSRDYERDLARYEKYKDAFVSRFL